jgi:SAM-dependent methyltransferase
VKGALVADIGCAFGQTAAFLNTLGVDVFGIDLSPRMRTSERPSTT